MNIKQLIKESLALNPAFLVRAARVGRADAVQRLLAAYQTIDPFGPVPKIGTSSQAAAFRPSVSQIVSAYCENHGLEIGPGDHPRCDPSRTEFLDKHGCRNNYPHQINIVADANHIPRPDACFDFVFSSHCLEHMPDTIRSLEEWKRVLKPGGFLVLVLPHCERTFDRGRSISTLEHHLEDYEARVGEEDFTNWDDWEAYSVKQYDHVWLNDPASRLPDGTIDRAWVVRQGHFHYHAWTQNEIADLCLHLRMNVRYVADQCRDDGNSFAVVARK